MGEDFENEYAEKRGKLFGKCEEYLLGEPGA
jgi:hypothetical protein